MREEEESEDKDKREQNGGRRWCVEVTEGTNEQMQAGCGRRGNGKAGDSHHKTHNTGGKSTKWA